MRKGTHHKKEAKEKISVFMMNKPGRNKGKKMPPRSEKYRKRMREACTRKKAYNYKGGRKSLVKRVRETFKYRLWRSSVFERDNWTCQTCSKRGCYIEAHHIKEIYKLIDEFKIKSAEQAIECEFLWCVSNGVTLCKECHNLTKKGRLQSQNQ